MATNLLESIQQQLTPELIEHVSSFLGETPIHTHKAVAVREAQISGEVDAARMTAADYGQENPFAYNGTEEDRAKNRRLELVVVKK